MPHAEIDVLNRMWERELPGLVNERSDLAKRIAAIGRQVTTTITETVQGHGLTLAEYDILAALRRHAAAGGLTPSGISRHLLLSSGGTSNALKRLKERDLVHAHDSATDKRSRSFTLTDAGRTLAEAALRDSVAAQTALFAGLDPELTRFTADALRQIAATLSTGASAPGG